jgi:N-alpha-acetyltransferase 40
MPTHKRVYPQSADPPSHSAMTKRHKRNPQPKSQSLIERTNALPLAQFSSQYYPQQTALAIESSINLHLSLTTWTEMPTPLREACISLLELTSRSHYHASEKGWSRAKKLREMRHPALKYLLLLLRPVSLEAGKGVDKVPERDEIEGFLSFMITEEDGHEVIYCYELHLQLRLQGKGVGRQVVELMEIIGGMVGVEKAMLTVFRSNERAVKAYGSWGYGVDEFSPEPRKLRDGTMKEPSYVILSKERGRFAQGGSDHNLTSINGSSNLADIEDLREEG